MWLACAPSVKRRALPARLAGTSSGPAALPPFAEPPARRRAPARPVPRGGGASQAVPPRPPPQPRGGAQPARRTRAVRPGTAPARPRRGSRPGAACAARAVSARCSFCAESCATQTHRNASRRNAFLMVAWSAPGSTPSTRCGSPRGSEEPPKAAARLQPLVRAACAPLLAPDCAASRPPRRRPRVRSAGQVKAPAAASGMQASMFAGVAWNQKALRATHARDATQGRAARGVAKEATGSELR